MTTPESVLEFWFGPELTCFEDVATFGKRLGPGLDDEIRERFGALVERAAAGDLSDWEQTSDGALALVIVLDQFPRHIFRGTAKQYRSDGLALQVALRALDTFSFASFEGLQRTFLIMPLHHSESIDHHERSLAFQVEITASMPAFFGPVRGVGLSQSKKYLHILKTFGRFPHRNGMLGRANTPEEKAWLDDGGADRMAPDLAALMKASPPAAT